MGIIILLSVFQGIFLVQTCNSQAVPIQEYPPATDSSLIFVFGIYRHGIRTPAFPAYSSDPYKNFSRYFPEGEGALTLAGKQLMHRFGNMLRKRYGAFFGRHYSRDNIHFVSTNIERTMMSAMLVSNGMFPPEGDQQWLKGTTWQPIPVWLDNNVMDKTLLFLNSTSCPKFKKAISVDVVAKAKAIDTSPERDELYKYVSKYAGDTFNSKFSLFALWDVLECERLNGLELPHWTEAVFPEKMKTVVADVFSSMVAETEFLFRTLSGPLFYFIHDLFLNKAYGTLYPNWKMYMHSGHDISVLSFLQGIRYKNPVIVRPGDGVFLELHQKESDYYVKLLYFSSLNKKESFEEIQVPGCRSPCSLTQFINLTTVISPDTWNWECSQ